MDIFPRRWGNRGGVVFPYQSIIHGEINYKLNLGCMVGWEIFIAVMVKTLAPATPPDCDVECVYSYTLLGNDMKPPV